MTYTMLSYFQRVLQMDADEILHAFVFIDEVGLTSTWRKEEEEREAAIFS